MGRAARGCCEDGVMALKATVLVTGATGFIGGRLVERLILEEGARVRVLLRDFAHAPRVARFPVEMIGGSVTDADAVNRAATGCDVIVHCAFGNSGTPEEKRAATIAGTEAVAEAARRAGVKRLVHLSTISVYGLPGDGDLDETAPRRFCGDPYSDAKIEAERLVLACHEKHGLPVAVLQPTIVYGPLSGPWTLAPLHQLKHERVVLVDGGGGLCNAVYVDDVVDAILLATTREEAVGQAFLISGDRPVTWRQFYAAFEEMLGQPGTVSLTAAEIQALHREERRARRTIPQLMRVLRRNARMRARLLELPALGIPYRWLLARVPERVRADLGRRLFSDDAPSARAKADRPTPLPNDYQVRFLRARTRVRTDKARRLLGYEPRVSFEHGMRLTSQWAAWANLL
jgi:nucleoside-diphosphate-sugar epimerase